MSGAADGKIALDRAAFDDLVGATLFGNVTKPPAARPRPSQQPSGSSGTPGSGAQRKRQRESSPSSSTGTGASSSSRRSRPASAAGSVCSRLTEIERRSKQKWMQFLPEITGERTDKDLRACQRCKMLKTIDQWVSYGCENCPELRMKGDRDRAVLHTTRNFEGFYAMCAGDRSDSWSMRWLGLSHDRLHHGAYALHLTKQSDRRGLPAPTEDEESIESVSQTTSATRSRSHVTKGSRQKTGSSTAASTEDRERSSLSQSDTHGGSRSEQSTARRPVLPPRRSGSGTGADDSRTGHSGGATSDRDSSLPSRPRDPQSGAPAVSQEPAPVPPPQPPRSLVPLPLDPEDKMVGGIDVSAGDHNIWDCLQTLPPEELGEKSAGDVLEWIATHPHTWHAYEFFFTLADMDQQAGYQALQQRWHRLYNIRRDAMLAEAGDRQASPAPVSASASATSGAAQTAEGSAKQPSQSSEVLASEVSASLPAASMHPSPSPAGPSHRPSPSVRRGSSTSDHARGPPASPSPSQ